MKSLLIFGWKLTRKSNRSRLDSSQGITMIELLVGVIMAFLILTPLLTFVVNILDTEKQEQAKTKIEQDVQNAADYITKDLEKAVFIYDAAGIAAGTPVRTALNNAGTQGEPILVFWRRELKPNTIPVLKNTGSGYSDCTQNQTATNKCDDTYIFSLVAYYLDNTLTANSPWSKQARIVRYSMNDCVKDPTNSTQCITANTNGLANLVDTNVVQKDPGFQPFSLALTPTDLTKNNIKGKMNLWPQQADGSTPTATFARNTVLVDYIDNGAAKTSPTCNIGSLIPSAAQKGFYACVSTDDSGKSIAQVVIRGNVAAYQDKNKNASCPDASSPQCPQVSVQVQARGVLAQ